MHPRATLALFLSSTLALGACGGSGEGDGELPDSFRVVVDTTGYELCLPPPIVLEYTVTEAGAAEPKVSGHRCTAAVDEGDAWAITCERVQNPRTIVLRLDRDLDGGDWTGDSPGENECDTTLPLLSVEIL